MKRKIENKKKWTERKEKEDGKRGKEMDLGII